MKNQTRKTEKSRLFYQMSSLVAFIVAGMLMVSCGPNKEEKAKMEKLREVKKSVTAELEKVNEDIKGRIAYLDTELEEATGEVKEQLEEARQMLVEQQNLVVKEMEEIKDCCIDEWDDRINKTSENLKQIRAKTSETSKKVRELLDS